MKDVKLQFRRHSLSALWKSVLLFLILFLLWDNSFLSKILGARSIFVILTLLCMWVNVYFSKMISMQISDDAIKIIDTKSNKATVFLNNTIDNYYFTTSKKGWLDILRIQVDGRNKYFWLSGVNFEGLDKADVLNKHCLSEKLEKAFPTRKKKTNIDFVILFSGAKIPYILAVMAIGMVIFLLVYVFFFIE
ncbi:hypothetical protein [Capnocytophaga canimorsus]|uniref:hypothetical protein n=1 Tax=Capnocytophaga canimorsus TaxID=28188 RepID=UPI0037DC3C60